MSAQTTVNQPLKGLHNRWLGASILAGAAIIAGLALAVALLGSVGKPVATESAPAFDAPAFRAEERAFQVLPVFDAPAFRAGERSLIIKAPLSFDAAGFRAEEKQPIR
jgi:hypothetical protein